MLAAATGVVIIRCLGVVESAIFLMVASWVAVFGEWLNRGVVIFLLYLVIVGGRRFSCRDVKSDVKIIMFLNFLGWMECLAIVFHLYPTESTLPNLGLAEGQGKKIPVYESSERIVVLIPGKLGYESL